MRLAFSSDRPAIRLWREFLSADECRQLIERSDARLTRSLVMNASGDGNVTDSVRTSEGASFSTGEHPLLPIVSNRASGLLGASASRFETMQVLRYRNGQEYRPHWDYFHAEHPSSASALLGGGQRTGTLLIYLETPDEGGDTSFPLAGMRFAATAGDALWFAYPEQDRLTQHAGEPVTRGTKRVATLWQRERAYPASAPDDVRVEDGVLTDAECSALRAVYDANVHRHEGGTDRVVRLTGQEPAIAPYVDRLTRHVRGFFNQPCEPETVVLASMPAGQAMGNHADNVLVDGTPNHTPNRIFTAVAMLSTGEGGVTHYGDNPGERYSLDVAQLAGRLHMHRCGINTFHRVSASARDRYTFIVWFKRP